MTPSLDIGINSRASAYYVARCPKCAGIMIFGDLRSQKTGFCRGCNSRMRTQNWIGLSTHESFLEAQRVCQGYKANSVALPEGFEIVPDPRPRNPVSKQERIERLLAEMIAEGGPFGEPDIEERFEIIDASKQLRSIFEIGAFLRVPGRGGMYSVSPSALDFVRPTSQQSPEPRDDVQDSG